LAENRLRISGFAVLVLKDVACGPNVKTGANVPSYSGGGRLEGACSNGQSVCEILARAPDPVRLGTEGRINAFASADEDASAPGGHRPQFSTFSFQLSAFSSVSPQLSPFQLSTFSFQLFF
jgi:hypothetical protein